jgi:hypothetical protein
MVSHSATPEFSNLDSIGRETPLIDELAIWEHCRQPKLVGECDDLLSIRKVRARITDDDCIRVISVHRIKHASVFGRLDWVIQGRPDNGNSDFASSVAGAGP